MLGIARKIIEYILEKHNKYVTITNAARNNKKYY